MDCFVGEEEITIHETIEEAALEVSNKRKRNEEREQKRNEEDRLYAKQREKNNGKVIFTVLKINIHPYGDGQFFR